MKGKLLIGLMFVLASCLEAPDEVTGAQWEKEVAEIDQYLLDHGILNDVKDATGIRVVVHTLGTAGLPPNSGSDLKVIYSGKLMSNGANFESGTAFGKLGNFIKGWQIGLQMLPEGSVATLYIPSTIAYGSRGSGSIPPNANLIFDVTLESVTPTTEQNNRLNSDIQIIDNYLSANSITAETHASGLRYEIITQGTGVTPGLYDQVKISYEGKILPNEQVFDNNVGVIEPTGDFSSRVINQIPGFQVALPMLQEGGKMRLYIPSGLGNGPIATSSIPANSNLFFEIELVDVY